MPSNIFKMDTKDLKRFQKIQKEHPRQFQYAAASVLTAQAWALKKIMPDIIGEEFNVRDPRFVKNSFRVQKAKGNQPIGKQFSIAGSISRSKNGKETFDGWADQQEGGKTDARYKNENSRGGNKNNKVQGKQRMNKIDRFGRAIDFKKKGNKMITNKRGTRRNYGYNHKTHGQQTVSMIINARKKSSSKPFVIEGNLPGRLGNYKDGVYMWNGSYISRSQLFGLKYNVKKTDWMGKSIRKLDRTFDLKKEWKKALDFQFKRR